MGSLIWIFVNSAYLDETEAAVVRDDEAGVAAHDEAAGAVGPEAAGEPHLPGEHGWDGPALQPLTVSAAGRGWS